MNNKAFSLIELMVTVVIIGILASMITINLTSARAKGRDAKRQADLEAVGAALEIYYSQNKTYPFADTMVQDWATLKNVLYPTYISTWPVDPKNEEGVFPTAYSYYYKVNATGSMFALDAKLEGKQSNCQNAGYDSSTDNFYVTGLICQNAGKYHYRVAGR